jgi:hypothetical protein
MAGNQYIQGSFMETIFLKRLLSGSSLLLIFLAVFIPSATAQVQTRSILYLKNGSIIKCNLVRIIPDSLFIVQTSDNNQWGYIYNQVDSLAISREASNSTESQKNILPKSSRSSSGGFILGPWTPAGEHANSYGGGLFVGAQFGSGSNPGFLAQFGCVSFGSGSNNLTVYGTLGARIKTNQSSSYGLFITPSLGVMTFGEVQLTGGISLDLYILPKVFLGTRFLTSLGSLSSSSSPAFSFVAFVMGYGVN